MAARAAPPSVAATPARPPRRRAEPSPPVAEVALDDDIAQHLVHLEVERHLALRTLTLYRDALQRLQAFAQAQPVALRAAQLHHVRRWAAQLHGRGLAPRSISLMLSAWRGFYRWLGRQGVVAQNPVEGVRAPKAAKPLPKALSVDQAVRLAEAAPGGGTDDAAQDACDQCLVELLYGCGLRVGELVGLDLRAGPLAAGWVDADDALAHVLGKGSKRRSVPVGGPALKSLAEWIVHRAGLAAVDEPALFVGRKGARMTAGQVRARVKKRALQAGLPTHVHPHMLRHSFASHVLQSSGDLRAVQELLGHAHIRATQVYTQLDFQHLAKVYDAAHPRAKASTKK
jgi:integrase/recombinase XerC